MDQDTSYTVMGTELSSLEITTDSKRFDVVLDTFSHVPNAKELNGVIEISISNRVGIRDPVSARVSVDADEDALYVSSINITPKLRSVGAPHVLVGCLYGIALWSDKDEIYGLVDYSRITEESLINAGIPKSNFIVAEDSNSMFFSAKLRQMDYSKDSFTIVKNSG